MQAIHQHQHQQKAANAKDPDARAKQQGSFFELAQLLVHLQFGHLYFLAEEGFGIAGNPTQQSAQARLWRLRRLRP